MKEQEARMPEQEVITVGRVEGGMPLIDADEAARLASTEANCIKNWWRARGVVGPAGRRIRLAVLKTPSGPRTTREALFDFLAAYDGEAQGRGDAPGQVRPATRQRLSALGMRVDAVA